MPPALKLFLSSTQTGQPKQVQSPELDQQELTERGKPTPTTCVGSTPITSARMTRRRSNVCGDRTREDTSSSEDAPRPATRRKTISFEETPTKRPRLRIVSNELDEAIAAAEQLIAFGRDVRDLGEVGVAKVADVAKESVGEKKEDRSNEVVERGPVDDNQDKKPAVRCVPSVRHPPLATTPAPPSRTAESQMVSGSFNLD